MQINNSETILSEELTTEKGSRTITQVVYSEGKLHQTKSAVIVETPITLTVNGEVWLSTLCTPVHVEAMAVGFLFNEGIITDLSAVASVRVCPQGDNIDVWLTFSVEKPRQWTRTSGCSGGVTGVGIPKKEQVLFANGGMLTPAQINQIMAEFYRVQKLYHHTGGVHTSALSDGREIILVAEDIGRHNTLDKLAGRCLLENISPARRILLTTGRISSEMLQKAARIKAPIVISRTSPSSRSIDMAHELGITLIGYARVEKFTIYTHPHRIINNNEQ
jgi:FdhD protein